MAKATAMTKTMTKTEASTMAVPIPKFSFTLPPSLAASLASTPPASSSTADKPGDRNQAPQTATLTFDFDDAVSPAGGGFHDIHTLDVRSSAPLLHPVLGQLSLAIRTGLAGPKFLDVHVIVDAPAPAPAAGQAAAVSASLFCSTRVTLSVSLQVVYSNEGRGEPIPLISTPFATYRPPTDPAVDSTDSAAETPKFNDVQSTLGPMCTTICLAPSASPPPVGSVYTCTLPHATLFSRRAVAPNQVRLTRAIVTVHNQPEPQGAGGAPLFQLPKSTPAVGPLGLISSLNQAHLCDAMLLPKDAPEPIHVSRAVLACASPYFRSMLSGHWAESAALAPASSTSSSAAAATGSPITLPYPAQVVIPCLIHMYAQWSPPAPMPSASAELVAKYKVDVSGFDRHTWNDVMDLADMWELHKLVLGANRALVGVLNQEYDRRIKQTIGEEAADKAVNGQAVRRMLSPKSK